MARAAPRVEAAVPAGWAEVSLARPALRGAESIEVVSWDAWGPPPGSPAPAALVTGCLAGTTPAWTPEAEPLVLDRLDALVASTALGVARAGAHRVVSEGRWGPAATRRLLGVDGAEGKLVARTFLGFVDGGDGSPGALVGCFALCASDVATCGPSVEGARPTSAFVAAPLPGYGVRAAMAAVHHPAAALSVILTTSLAGAIAAVATRRRPRAK